MSARDTLKRLTGRTKRPRRNSRNSRVSRPSQAGGLRRPEVPSRVRTWAGAVRYRISWTLRMFVRALPYALVALILAVTPIAVVYGYRYVTAAPDFKVQNVHVEGHRYLSIEEILQTANVAHAPNLLKLDLREVENRLLTHPWILSATVQRELPGQLFIKVVERTPVALLALDGPLYLVDKRANIFSRTASGEHFDLPILTGLTRSDLATDATDDRKALTRSLVRGALTLMDVWRMSSVGHRIEVSEIHMDPLLGLSVVLGKGSALHRGAVVRLGRGQLPDKLERLEAIVDHAAAEGRSIARVMLDNSTDPTRVAVSFKHAAPETGENNDASEGGAAEQSGEQDAERDGPGGRSSRQRRPHRAR